MLRYRSSLSSTRTAIAKAIRHLPRLGVIREVRGTRVGLNEYTTFVGSEGTARFGGFLWGYHGEGPRGLISILTQVGVHPDYARWIVPHLKRWDNDGVDWTIKITPQGVVTTLRGN